jgi:PAS domain S-box-containing protein
VTLRLIVRILALAAVYAVVARLGLAIDAVDGFATLVWPPTGIALATLVLAGPRLWPGVLLGAFAVNLWVGAPVAVAAAIAVGNTFEAVLGAHALRRLGFQATLDRVRDVGGLVLLAALGTTLVSASIGVLSLRLAGRVPAADIGEAWRDWWLGDLTGDLVIAPLLLTWARRPTVTLDPLRPLAVVALTIAPLLVAVLVFVLPLPQALLPFRRSFLLFPALVWPALRFGPRGVAAMTFLISVVAIAGTVGGHGLFAHGRPRDNLAALQVFIAAMAIGLLVLGALVAERRRAELAAHQGHALLRAVVDGTTDPVFAKDLDGRYLLINQAGARTLGRPVSEILGQGDSVLFPAASAPANTALDRSVVASGEPLTSEESVVISGDTQVFLSTKAPFRDEHGHVVGLVGIARDITERKRNEKALIDAVGARDEFLSIASHELRTPLTVLAIELGGLRRRLQKVPPAVAATVNEVIGGKLDNTLRQTDRLNRLIENLLEVSRISSGRLRIDREPLDLAALVADVVERFAETASHVGCTLALHAAAPVPGHWDRLRLEQVVTNLLSNALKYGAGKPVELTVTSDGARASLAVRDHGIGIGAADIARIFGRFERAVSPRHFGGLGLGLYITRQIAEAHGGAIRVDSRPDEGSTFTVDLPHTLASLAPTES